MFTVVVGGPAPTFRDQLGELCIWRTLLYA
jgi:hypothetical protein